MVKPIQTQETNVNLVHPQCFDLPAYCEKDAEGNTVFLQSVWELTTEELMQVLHSGKIALTIWGDKHPPVRLDILHD